VPKAEGKQFDFLGEEAINPSFLETFAFQDVEQYIKTQTHEFSAVCPFSGLPDFAYLKIEYFPTGKLCVELKSLKYYITSFRNVGIYQEACTTRIYDDLRKALHTDRLQVTTIYNIRGGFRTTCVRGNLEKHT
jgi:7-cyano-7-deazaguanine reductase